MSATQQNELRKQLIEKGYITPAHEPVETVMCAKCGTPFDRLLSRAKWDDVCGLRACRWREGENKS